jgi:hypothetical protein
MNIPYELGGMASIAIGFYITKMQYRKIKAGEDDQLGFDYKGLGGGIILIMVGIALILKIHLEPTTYYCSHAAQVRQHRVIFIQRLFRCYF